jgi:hypothetical protein
MKQGREGKGKRLTTVVNEVDPLSLKPKEESKGPEIPREMKASLSFPRPTFRPQSKGPSS